jgi:hypothetical protein
VKTFRACILALVAITSATPAKPQQQKPATQAQLQQQIDELKKQLEDVRQTVTAAKLTNDFAKQAQAEAKDYYDKVLATETRSLWIMGIFITLLLALAARVGFNTFERLTEGAIREATTQLRADYTKALADEVQKLKDLNKTNITELEQTLTSKIGELDADIQDRTYFQFQFTQALAFSADKRFDQAIESYREAIKAYKESKSRRLIRPTTAATAIGNLLSRVAKLHAENREEMLKEELAKPLYDDLEDELAHAAIKRPIYAALIKERNTPVTPQTAALAGLAGEPPPAAPAEPDTQSE